TFGLIRAERRRIEAEQATRREADRADGEEKAKFAEQEAREREGEQRARAEQAYSRTADVLDAMVSDATGDSLATQKAISPEQRKFLEEVLTYYQEFAAVRGVSETTRARAARAASQVGRIEYRMGRRERGAAAFARARDEFAALAADFPA